MKKLNKKCSKCNKKKSINHFRINNQMKCGYDSWCKECDNQCALEYYYKNKQYILKKRQSSTIQKQIKNYHLLKKYNITIEEYSKLLKKQNNKCAICHKLESHSRNNKIYSLAVDHCHKTGKVRGLLCTRCNMILGKSYENIKLLKEMIKYLSKKHKFNKS